MPICCVVTPKVRFWSNFGGQLMSLYCDYVYTQESARSDAFIRTNWRGLLESHEEEKNEKTSFVAFITNTVPAFRMWDDKFSKSEELSERISAALDAGWEHTYHAENLTYELSIENLELMIRGKEAELAFLDQVNSNSKHRRHSLKTRKQ